MAETVDDDDDIMVLDCILVRMTSNGWNKIQDVIPAILPDTIEFFTNDDDAVLVVRVVVVLLADDDDVVKKRGFVSSKRVVLFVALGVVIVSKDVVPLLQ